jgi:hypothetical protein
VGGIGQRIIILCGKYVEKQLLVFMVKLLINFDDNNNIIVASHQKRMIDGVVFGKEVDMLPLLFDDAPPSR